MKDLFWGLLVVFVVSAMIVRAIMSTAKAGYQDKDGFHHGPPPDKFHGE